MQELHAQKLLKKYLAGKCTEEEKALLETWHIRSKGIGLPEIPEDAQNQAMAEVWARLPIPQNQRVRPLWPRIAAAAIAILVLGTGILYYTSHSNPGTEQNARNLNIIPGGNKAILTLANGSKISLSDATLGQVAAQSGVKISKTENGTLVYDAAGSDDNSSKLEYNTVEAPAGGQWQVRLPDGSVVFLNALSSVTYPTRFTGNERRVKMQGEAYFEIAHNKAMPFRVTSLGQTVEVLGTHFNIMAYTDEKTIKTTLLEGAVKISGQGKATVLKPGEQAQVSGANIKVTDAVDLEDVMAWKNGYFKFNESLESIMNKVARWYDVKIIYQTKPDPTLAFGGKILRSKNIQSVLRIMESTGNVQFKIEGRKVIVMK